MGIDIAAVITSSAATGVLGFAFWTVAARGFSIAEVGRASAIISSATLIAILANFSLGSLYERFLPVSGQRAGRLITSGGVFVVAAALLFGTVFMLVGPRTKLFHSWPEAALFPVFVAILAIFALQDQILIGLGKARTIATKNITQSTAKLAAVAALIPLASGSAIVWAWVLPTVVIAVWIGSTVIIPVSRRMHGISDLPPKRQLWEFFAGSYAINAVGVIVPLLVPLIIVATLGTEMNAYFSVCWLVVNTVGVLIYATSAPFVSAAATPGTELRAATVRFGVMCSGAAILGCVTLLLAAPALLGILGPQYADRGTDLIRLMALTLPSMAVMAIYTALARLHRRLRLAVAVQILLGVLVVGGVIVTTPRWGIDAVGYTYIAAELLCTAIIAVPTILLLRKVFVEPGALVPGDTQPLTAVIADAPCNGAGDIIDADIYAASVPSAFAAVAAQRANHIAVRTTTSAVSYRELAAAAELWTLALRSGHDSSTVAMLAGMDTGSVAATLGCFSAGRLLVPLDPALPADRATEIMSILRAHDLGVGSVIFSREHRTAAITLAGDCPAWPTDIAPAESGSSLAAVPQQHPQTPTSIQFTSGSTGAPKGVVHTHGTWLCDAVLMRDRFGMTTGRRVAVCMPISFAAGLNVLIGALLSGAEVLAMDPRSDTPQGALDNLAEIEILACTPSYLQALVDAAGGRKLLHLGRIVTTGEPVRGELFRRAQLMAPHAVLTNWAGSSETLGIAHYDVAPGTEVADGVLPAGIPTPHKQIDIGPDGRIRVTSRYLALRYLDPRGASTEFLDNADGTRTFVTGDRGRRDDAGNLVMIGRIDSAVKIRGYLVEPAEVEAVLLGHPAVREAVVTVNGTDASPTLTAYVAPVADARTPSVAELRAELHRRLPQWMVPHHVLILPALPRTERGKLDRRALPEPERGPIIAPTPGRESDIARIWATVLCLDEVGRDENFYALGGDSLSVQQMLGRIKERYEVTLASSDLAVAPTVSDFAAVVTAHRAGGAPAQRASLAATTVALRPRSDNTVKTVFCFAGAGASALTFMPFSDNVGDDVAVYAFQPQGLENRGFPDWSVSRAARRHVTDLLRVQSVGPFTLIGHSLGAFIALEVAQLLRDRGHSVELVAMLDPFLPPRAMRTARQSMPNSTLTLEASPMSRGELWRNRVWLPLAGIAPLSRETQTVAVREVGVRVGLLHRPRQYSGRTLVVLSHLNQDDERLWPFVLTGEYGVERIDCNHDSVVREPHVRHVAQLIAARTGPANAMRLS